MAWPDPRRHLGPAPLAPILPPPCRYRALYDPLNQSTPASKRHFLHCMPQCCTMFHHTAPYVHPSPGTAFLHPFQACFAPSFSGLLRRAAAPMIAATTRHHPPPVWHPPSQQCTSICIHACYHERPGQRVWAPPPAARQAAAALNSGPGRPLLELAGIFPRRSLLKACRALLRPAARPPAARRKVSDADPAAARVAVPA